MMNYNNIGMIMQPHFMSQCFRVAAKDQMSEKTNYIVVTCSPSYNGVYKYDGSLRKSFNTWRNGRLDCLCVPITVCTKIKDLDELNNPEMIKEVKKQQNKWFKNEFKNVEHKYVNKPKWMM